jgi:hypothetical protein
MEAMIANTIPIYWGNPLIARDFNPQCFINCHDFESFDDVISYVAEVDQDDDLYRQFILAPAFSNGVDNTYINTANIGQRFDKIFSGTSRSNVAGSFDRLKYMFHPSRSMHYVASRVRARRQNRNKK